MKWYGQSETVAMRAPDQNRSGDVPKHPLPAVVRQNADRWYVDHYDALQRSFRLQFRAYNPEAREEMTAEALALAWEYVVSAANRGLLHHLTPTALASYFARNVQGGRRFIGTCTTDMMQAHIDPRSNQEQRPHRTSFQDAIDRIAEPREATPYDNVRRSVDYPDILSRPKVTARMRHVFSALATAPDAPLGLLADRLHCHLAQLTRDKRRLSHVFREAGYSP